MRILQHNLNHCEAAHDLKEMKMDLIMIADSYTEPSMQAWVTDATGKAAIWSSRTRTFEDYITCR